MTAKTIQIFARCDETTVIDFFADDQVQTVVGEVRGAVPNFSWLTGTFWGRDGCLSLVIDLETGQIQGWRAPTDEQIAAFLKGGDDR